MNILYFDCFSGASGDMILGALLDAGLPLEDLRAALGSLALGDVKLEVERVDRSGIGATNFKVFTGDHGHQHDEGHGHDHHHHDHDPAHDHPPSHAHDPGHHHRGLSEICTMVDGSALSPTAKDRAKHLFTRLATVEAEIHQQPVEEIHLHEVGAVDSIIDIAGTVFGLEWLGADRDRGVPLERGIRNGRVRARDHAGPGASYRAAGCRCSGVLDRHPGRAPHADRCASDYRLRRELRPRCRRCESGSSATCAGDRDLPGAPNVLRIAVGNAAGAPDLQRVVVLESEIDDMNPQIFGVLMDQLLTAGALDVFYAPIQMKKNRPGTLVSVVALPEHRDALSGVLFRETTTLGVRFSEMDRERLEREIRSVETPLGAVRFKVARRDGQVVNAAPEFDDCARLAEQHGLSIKQVQAIATKAYLDL